MVLVTGASGYVGSRVIDQIPGSVACVRDPSKLRAGTGYRVADYDDPSSLRAAFAGVETLLFIPSDGFAADMARHCENVISAAEACQVGHFVFLSIVDVAPESPFYYAWVYREAEAKLRSTGLGCTILRCGLYADFVLTSFVRPVMELPAGEAGVSLISRQDVSLALASVAGMRADKRILSLTGAEALSFREIAYQAGVSFRSISATDYLERLGSEMEEPWPEAFASMFESIGQGRFSQVSGDFEWLTGQRQETFSAFLSRRWTEDRKI